MGENKLLGKLFHSYTNDPSRYGSHAQRRDVQTCRNFDSDREDGHHDFEDQGEK